MTEQSPWDQSYWDAKYADSDRVWSGDPNGTLVDEVSGVAPGRALDLGCGEGDDARWLAARGWTVTAVDISQVAVDRARAVEGDAAITWLRSDIVADGVPPGPFDLVSMMYFPIQKPAGAAAVAAVLDAVEPGGILLVVGHETYPVDDIHTPADIAALLDPAAWEIVTHETRARRHSGKGGGGHHSHDVVVVARRRA
ncbi:class I SAM-dependent methyltransferase [Williamsia deligens]|nr:class I SAM-dependent methyltransferase [Williamsia deligens]MCP2194876.1 Methyltransferase domain-containing protein [Williamsia deligens]